MATDIKKVVLAYSGGLDTSIILKWIKEEYGAEVVTYTADVGQGEEVEEARVKALETGATEAICEDLTKEFVTDYIFPMFKANALYETYAIADDIRGSGDEALLEDWRKLQTSDHFYYMCTKYFADGDVHKYFNPYDSPYDAYMTFMTVLDNLNSRCHRALLQKEQEPFSIVRGEALPSLK